VVAIQDGIQGISIIKYIKYIRDRCQITGMHSLIPNPNSISMYASMVARYGIMYDVACVGVRINHIIYGWLQCGMLMCR
jgi:hypothetical protein